MIRWFRARAEAIGAAMAPPASAFPDGRGVDCLEIQIHPTKARRVRYLVFRRGKLTLWCLVVLLDLFAVLFGAVLAPGVIRTLLDGQQSRRLLVERERHGDRLQVLVRRLNQLGEQSTALRLRMSKIFLAYGLRESSVPDTGESPAPQVPVPPTVFAGLVHQGNRLHLQIDHQLQRVDALLGAARRFEAAHPAEALQAPTASPLAGEFVLTRSFARLPNPFTRQLAFHSGLDLAASAGAPIRSPGEGVVVFAGRVPESRSVRWWRYGNLVVLRLGDRYAALFGHCGPIRVRVGQRVRRGETIAEVGSSGWSPNPHLYYEIRKRDRSGTLRPVDPRVYMLDHPWPSEERLLLDAWRGFGPRPYEIDPLPGIG